MTVESNIMSKKAKKMSFYDKISINSNKYYAFAKRKMNLESQNKISKVNSCKF